MCLTRQENSVKNEKDMSKAHKSWKQDSLYLMVADFRTREELDSVLGLCEVEKSTDEIGVQLGC